MAFALSDLQIRSSAFDVDGLIPSKYTGEGEDVSPALHWTNAPAETQAFALLCHDPDAPLISPDGTYGFVHWLLYNIPGQLNKLDEACGEFTQGHNDFSNLGYGGPMPPPGHGEHKYYFSLLALGKDLNLPAGLTMCELLQKIEAHVIGMNRLVGRYQRD